VFHVKKASTLVVFAMVVGAATASAATRPSMHVSPTVVSPGGRITVWGNADGCPRGDNVTIISRAFPLTHSFAGVGAIFARVRTGGAFSATGHVRLHARGRYGITARCGGGNLGVIVYVRVR
jgi:hypothetical protein